MPDSILGADDYLTKPFFIEELVARIPAITRRQSGDGQGILAVADLSLNLLTREVRRGETRSVHGRYPPPHILHRIGPCVTFPRDAAQYEERAPNAGGPRQERE